MTVLLQPAISFLPGSIGLRLLSVVRDVVLNAGTKGLANLIENHLIFPPGLDLGRYIKQFCEVMEGWFEVNVWWILRADSKLVGHSYGSQDYGLDSRQNRMTQVYDETGKRTCDPNNMKRFHTVMLPLPVPRPHDFLPD